MSNNWSLLPYSTSLPLAGLYLLNFPKQPLTRDQPFKCTGLGEAFTFSSPHHDLELTSVFQKEGNGIKENEHQGALPRPFFSVSLLWVGQPLDNNDMERERRIKWPILPFPLSSSLPCNESESINRLCAIKKWNVDTELISYSVSTLLRRMKIIFMNYEINCIIFMTLHRS